MSNNKRSGMFAGKGYLLALILCAAAIGVTGYLYSKDEVQVEEVSLLGTEEDILAGITDTEDVAVIATTPQQPIQARPVPTEPAKPAVKSALKTMSPVPGEPIFAYSVEALSYNQTTRDWRVHNGVDLACDEGAPVAAAAAGEVESASREDAMGYTVVIRHQDGYATRYASLSEDLTVAPGQRVDMGQTIGYASDSAIVESSLGAHVHFAAFGPEGAMDPAEFLALGQ